jgi:hypothetical protein
MARLDRPVSRRQSQWLLLAAVTAFAPLTTHMPVWLAVFAGAAFVWRGWLIQRGGRLAAALAARATGRRRFAGCLF